MPSFWLMRRLLFFTIISPRRPLSGSLRGVFPAAIGSTPGLVTNISCSDRRQMDGSFFFWENTGQEQQRHSPHVNHDALGDFPTPIPLEAPLAPSVNSGGYGNPAPLLPPDLFPGAYTSHAASATFQHEFTALTSWDAALSSWLPQSAQQLSQTPPPWDDGSRQPHWDDFVSSDSHPNSRFPSAAPSSIPDDNDWSSRWSSSSSRPVSAAPSSVYDNLGEDRSTDFVPASSLSVSVEIGPWDYTGGDNEPS
ncbi:hypothetical protein B0H10DRAFT_1956100, partial [Mycena sp. CBHHK59/15]